MTGAEKLLGRGDMLTATPGAIKPMRVQGAYISDEDINRIIAPMKTEDADFDTGLAKAMEMGKKLLSIKKDEDDEEHEKETDFLSDPKFLEAVDVALTQGQISTALLQRRLSIGFGKAAKYIDAMEAMGIVSEKCGAKPRVVLLTREEWAMKLSRAEL
jgi:S-DNA-T family DNA segregation ATPase FtsK/SpoIIIE